MCHKIKGRRLFTDLGGNNRQTPPLSCAKLFRSKNLMELPEGCSSVSSSLLAAELKMFNTQVKMWVSQPTSWECTIGLSWTYLRIFIPTESVNRLPNPLLFLHSSHFKRAGVQKFDTQPDVGADVSHILLTKKVRITARQAS